MRSRVYDEIVESVAMCVEDRRLALSACLPSHIPSLEAKESIV